MIEFHKGRHMEVPIIIDFTTYALKIRAFISLHKIDIKSWKRKVSKRLWLLSGGLISNKA
jgi:hypothetical protein